ncbi:uncharacterized protein LOC9648823 [Selaginella moellendorffii]|uniref:uncharacterized protein LOC9648823 n=1 Tax=Selaginella moellendorffii TaxID=88036 RepID=UPI000D1CB642|nr:uncharacterized protein LOC9648823 [Selaginella moellendorffii]|eukprot:XP_024537070.1 uncharacterized protein LOC9648823 [Selaginella moellendorffii]
MDRQQQQQHGLPVVNHLLQHTLRSICTESQWVYAVLWRILPRNYPPPKWDNESGFLDRSKGNKRNWILTWEDGFCDFAACVKSFKQSSSGDSEAASAEPLQPELFFKMSHEVYSYGEGLMGKVASDSSHKWIFRDPADQDSSLVSPWHGSLDPHPRTWEAQFKAGIQTIAIVAVQEGLLQLGSLDKVLEDLNLVILLQRKFTYLQTIPGVFAPHPNTLNHSIRPRVPLQSSAMRSSSSSYGVLDDSFIGLTEQQRFNLMSLGARTPPGSYTIQDHRSLAMDPNNTTLKQQQQQDHTTIVPSVGLKRTSSSCSDTNEDQAAMIAGSSGRKIPERPPLSKSLNTGHSSPGVVPHLHPSMSSLHALLSKLPSVSDNALVPPPQLSRSLSAPAPYQIHPDDLPKGYNVPSSTTISSTKNTIPDATTKGGSSPLSVAKDRLSVYLEAFENVPDFGIQCDMDPYHSFLSEIIN